MAELYDVIASQTVAEFVPPLGIRDVQEVTITAKPSGVTFPVHIQMADMNAATLPKILGPLAQAFNHLAAYNGVVDVQVQEDVKNSGQIVQYIIVTVESDNGDLQQDIRLAWGQEFVGGGGYTMIDTTRNNLNAIAES